MILPEQLAEIAPLKRWVAFRLIPKSEENRTDKKPLNIFTGYGASSTDPNTWATYQQAADAVSRYNLDGVGFEFGAKAPDGYCCLDIDHCIDESGSITSFAREIISLCGSYTEISPSGTGIHILGRYTGSSPRVFKSQKIEMYNHSRFLTVTGNIYRSPKGLKDLTAVWDLLVDRYTFEREAAKAPKNDPPKHSTTINMGDKDLLEKAFNAQNGDRIRHLYEGDISLYGNDHSRADSALCSHLLFWTQGDIRRADSLFRQSGLMRKKWDEKRGAKTYGALTMEKALVSMDSFYEPSMRRDDPEIQIYHNGGRLEPTTETDKPAKKAQQATNTAPNISLKPVSDFERKSVSFLFPGGWLPKGKIVLMAGDGGCGKTSVWAMLAAAVSRGKYPDILGKIPFDVENERGRVMYFSSEDDTSEVLRRRLERYGADLQNIFTLDIQDERFKNIYFGSPLLESMVAKYKPVLLIFDPIQGFLQDGVQMERRNSMRKSLTPLMALGEKYGVTILIVAHTNKRQNASGRNRIADSSDLWDCSRQVVVCGKTPDGCRYLSVEKSNYSDDCPPPETILMDMRNGRIQNVGTTSKRDADFQAEWIGQMSAQKHPQSKDRENLREDILAELKNNGGSIGSSELVGRMVDLGYTKTLTNKVRKELIADGTLEMERTGQGKGKGVIHTLKLASGNYDISNLTLDEQPEE